MTTKNLTEKSNSNGRVQGSPLDNLTKPPHIQQKHWDEWILNSGIAPDIAAQCLRSYLGTDSDRKEIARLMGWKGWKNGGGWIAFGVDPVTGQTRDEGIQFKPDNPQPQRDGDGLPKLDENGKPKLQKYLGRKGSAPCPLFLPLRDKTWAEIEADPSIPITLSEGGKKVGCLISHDKPTISIPGVTTGQKLGTLHPELERFAMGRIIYLAFDADWITNPNVKRALTTLATLLQSKGAIVRIVSWDISLGKGVDDLIVAHGFGQYLQAVEESLTFAAWIKAEKAKMQTGPTQPSSGASAQVGSDPRIVPESIPLALEFQGKSIEAIIVDFLFEEAFGYPIEDMICLTDKLYRWNGTHYDRLDDVFVKRTVQQYCKRLYTAKTDKLGNITEVEYPYQVDMQAGRVVQAIKTRRSIHADDLPKSGINLKNGTLTINWKGVIPEFELKPHDRNNYYMHCSQVDWNPQADTTQAERLLDVLPDHQKETFLRHISISLGMKEVLPFIGRPRSGLHCGEGSNGKDSLRQNIAHLFGKIGCYTFMDFQVYDSGKKFPLAMLPSYQLSWSSENSHKIKLENLKSLMAAIVGNSDLDSEYKNKDQTTYTPVIQLHFSLNKPPATDAGSTFITSRFVVYDYLKTFSENPVPGQLPSDPRFAYDEEFRLTQVCPGLLRLITEAFTRLCRERKIDWSPCEGSLQEWARESNHLAMFAHEYGLVASTDDYLSVKDIYEKLKQWYVENEYARLNYFEGESSVQWLGDPADHDRAVRRSNDLFKRLKDIFPRIRKDSDSDGKLTGRRNAVIVCGLTFRENPETLTHKDIEAKSDSCKADIEAETLTHKDIEAKQVFAIGDFSGKQGFLKNVEVDRGKKEIDEKVANGKVEYRENSQSASMSLPVSVSASQSALQNSQSASMSLPASVSGIEGLNPANGKASQFQPPATLPNFQAGDVLKRSDRIPNSRKDKDGDGQFVQFVRWEAWSMARVLCKNGQPKNLDPGILQKTKRQPYSLVPKD